VLRVLFLGDVFSRAGRWIVRDELPALIREEGVGLCIANGENASGGRGMTLESAMELFSYGIAALSGGNHSFQQGGSEGFLDNEPKAIRPYNYPAPCPGRGWVPLQGPAGEKLAFGNLMGRVFMHMSLDCPFRAADRMLAEMKDAGAQITIIDFHAEATAEKKAMAYYLDGRVGALLGTHTHVQTADHQILPGGTAYMTDVGMTGAQDSVIGMEKAEIVQAFLDGRRHKFKPSTDMASMEGVLVDFGEDGLATGIKAVNRPRVFRESL
jgi:metallophosphoesterase (TIGR00282 family)